MALTLYHVVTLLAYTTPDRLAPIIGQSVTLHLQPIRSIDEKIRLSLTMKRNVVEYKSLAQKVWHMLTADTSKEYIVSERKSLDWLNHGGEGRAELLSY